MKHSVESPWLFSGGYNVQTSRSNTALPRVGVTQRLRCWRNGAIAWQIPCIDGARSLTLRAPCRPLTAHHFMSYRSELSSSPSVGVGARPSTGVPRSPLSAVAALPSQTYLPPLRHGQAEQQPRSAVDHSETTLASGARGQVARDDRLTQSMPPSPYLDAARRDYRICQGERHPPETQERVFSRQERPLSPPPSATSGGSSPSDSARPPSSWRPW